MRNFELDRDRLELILCAEKFDNWNSVFWGEANASARKLFELSELGYIFENIIKYVEEHPNCQCKQVAKSFPCFGEKDGYYSNQKITSAMHKLLRKGILKREIKEEAMLIPRYPWKKDSEMRAIKAEIPFFSLA